MAKVGDIEIEVERCGHCGAFPTNEEIVEAVQRDEKQRSSLVCAVCMKRIGYSTRKLTHHYFDGKRAWLVDGMIEPFVQIYDYIGSSGERIEARVHTECFKKVAPGAHFEKR